MITAKENESIFYYDLINIIILNEILQIQRLMLGKQFILFALI
jgi:hypothetical protein